MAISKKISERTVAITGIGAVFPITQTAQDKKISIDVLASTIEKTRSKVILVYTGTTYNINTLTENTYVRFTNASGCTVTVPEISQLAIGQTLTFIGLPGNVSLVPESVNVVFNKPSDKALRTRLPGSTIHLLKIDVSTFDLSGDLQ